MSNVARGRREVAWQLALAGLALLVAWVYEPQPVAWLQCGFRAVTGYWCPGCGGTRMAHALAHGRLAEALRYNVLFCLFLPVVLCYWLRALRARWRGERPPPIAARWLWAIGALVLGFWLLRNLPGWPFNLLAPRAISGPAA